MLSSGYERFEVYWLVLFASLTTKVPMMPMLIWLLEAQVEALPAGSTVLALVLLKIGPYYVEHCLLS
ncbi:unnamed protein product [Discosporangium mesarthrocarpum]